MQGSKPSKLSKDLGNIVATLKSGKTRGNNPRDLTQDEISSLEQQRDSLRSRMRENAAARLASRVASEVVPPVTAHVTADNDRAIAALTEVGRGYKEEIVTAVAAQQQRAPAADEGSILNIVERADALNVPDLKALLAQKGFPSIGKKRVLLTAVANNISAAELEEFIRSRASLAASAAPKRKRPKTSGSDTASTTASSVGSCETPAHRQTRLSDFFGRHEEYEVGQKLSCIYTDGDRANARRTITVLEHIMLTDGPAIRVEEEDAEGIGREVSSYYLSKMVDVQLLERSSGSAEGPPEAPATATL